MVAMFGAGAMTNSIPEIRDTDMMFVIGSNTSEAHPIIAMEMKIAVKRGSRLIVADPRAIWMSGIAEKHLQLYPGTAHRRIDASPTVCDLSCAASDANGIAGIASAINRTIEFVTVILPAQFC